MVRLLADRRNVLRWGGAMIGLFLTNSSSALAAAKPSIQISTIDCDDDVAPGDDIANLSVANKGNHTWIFSLTDSAGGMFAVSGAKLVVGSAGLNHDHAPTPKITVRATSGKTVLTRTVAINVRRPLPTLPLAAGSRLAAIGDSYTGYNNYQGTTIVPAAGNSWAINYTQAYGFIEWARAFDPRFNFDSWYDPTDPAGRNISGADQGIFGAHLEWNNEERTGVLTRLPGVLSGKPDILILQGGTNTIGSGDIAGSSKPGFFADITTKLEKGLRQARNEGVWVILPTLYVRGDWPQGDPRYRTLAAVNSWVRAQSGREGVLGVLDANSILSPGNIQDASMFQADKVHLSPKGALLVGRDFFLPILRTAVSAGSVFDQNPATSNLYAAAFGNLAGTGGGKGSAQVTGNVADNLRVVIARNASAVVCSKADLGGGLSGQVLDITPTNNNSAAYGEVDITLLQVLTSGSMAAGDWVYHALFIEQLSGPQLSTARVQFQLRNSATVIQNAIAMSTSSGDFANVVPLAAGAGWWLKTNPMQLPAGVAFSNLLATLNICFPKTGSPFQVRLSRPILRKAADPRPVWGYPT